MSPGKRRIRRSHSAAVAHLAPVLPPNPRPDPVPMTDCELQTALYRARHPHLEPVPCCRICHSEAKAGKMLTPNLFWQNRIWHLCCERHSDLINESPLVFWYRQGSAMKFTGAAFAGYNGDNAVFFRSGKTFEVPRDQLRKDSRDICDLLQGKELGEKPNYKGGWLPPTVIQHDETQADPNP